MTPYCRRVCYWAKSSLFKNPMFGAMVTSSRSIPIYHNPNSSSLLIPSNGNSSQAACFATLRCSCSWRGHWYIPRGNVVHGTWNHASEGRCCVGCGRVH
ncbi:hypothetical protein BD769DRAFT_1509830 [Suillus cothurnatus]|nr:hypothetical protein BD769DRAFT_1509830 [Suillus cothurnatus]